MQTGSKSMFLTSGYQITQPPTYPDLGPYHWGVSDESTLCPYAFLATICQEKNTVYWKNTSFSTISSNNWNIPRENFPKYNVWNARIPPSPIYCLSDRMMITINQNWQLDHKLLEKWDRVLVLWIIVFCLLVRTTRFPKELLGWSVDPVHEEKMEG